MSALTRNIPTNRSTALSNVSAQVVAANAGRNGLIIQNCDASIVIAINLTGAAAVVNGAGSLTMAAGATLLLDTLVPTSAIQAISASGTPNITILEF